MSDASAIPAARAQTQAQAPAKARSLRGMAMIDRGLLLGIVLVTCIVSLPRFHRMLLASNELDASRAAQILANALAEARLQDPGLEVDGPHLAQWLARTPALTHRLEDLRLAPDGDSVLYHGYQFMIHTDEQGPLVLAWPTRLNRSGRWAYAQRPHRPAQRTQAWSQVGFPPRLSAQDAAHWKFW